MQAVSTHLLQIDASDWQAWLTEFEACVGWVFLVSDELSNSEVAVQHRKY